MLVQHGRRLCDPPGIQDATAFRLEKATKNPLGFRSAGSSDNCSTCRMRKDYPHDLRNVKKHRYFWFHRCLSPYMASPSCSPPSAIALGCVFFAWVMAEHGWSGLSSSASASLYSGQSRPPSNSRARSSRPSSLARHSKPSPIPSIWSLLNALLQTMFWSS